MADESLQTELDEREGRVLVVDDDRDVLESLVDILESRGYEAALALERASLSLAAGGRAEPPDPSLVERLERHLSPLLDAIRELPGIEKKAGVGIRDAPPEADEP